MKSLIECGFEAAQVEAIHRMLARKKGLVLVASGTSGGKSTSARCAVNSVGTTGLILADTIRFKAHADAVIASAREAVCVAPLPAQSVWVAFQRMIVDFCVGPEVFAQARPGLVVQGLTRSACPVCGGEDAVCHRCGGKGAVRKLSAVVIEPDHAVFERLSVGDMEGAKAIARGSFREGWLVDEYVLPEQR